MTVYERIENLRKSRGISSQGKLEKELGFSNGSISKWKTSMPTPERLQKLADFFGVSVEYLITGEERTIDYVVRNENGSEVLVETYYLNEETKEIAQEIYENKALRMLFDVSRKASPERLMAYYNLIKAMQDTEKGE